MLNTYTLEQLQMHRAQLVKLLIEVADGLELDNPGATIPAIDCAVSALDAVIAARQAPAQAALPLLSDITLPAPSAWAQRATLDEVP